MLAVPTWSTFPTDDGIVHAVDDVIFDVAPAETLGIVGESGSGKTVTSMAMLGCCPTATVTGEMLLRGREPARSIARSSFRTLRGNKIAMVFQDALAALNPVFRVGDQIAEAITVHHSPSKDECATG